MSRNGKVRLKVLRALKVDEGMTIHQLQKVLGLSRSFIQYTLHEAARLGLVYVNGKVDRNCLWYKPLPTTRKGFWGKQPKRLVPCRGCKDVCIMHASYKFPTTLCEVCLGHPLGKPAKPSYMSRNAEPLNDLLQLNHGNSLQLVPSQEENERFGRG